MVKKVDAVSYDRPPIISYTDLSYYGYPDIIYKPTKKKITKDTIKQYKMRRGFCKYCFEELYYTTYESCFNCNIFYFPLLRNWGS